MVDWNRVNRVVDALHAVLSELEEASEQRDAAEESDGRYTVDSSVSVGTVDDFLDRARDEQPGRDAFEDPSLGGERDAEESLVTTRTTDDGLVIVADVPGAPGRSDDLDVTFDRASGTLTFGTDDGELGRVPLDDERWTVGTVSVTNGVLEIELHQD